jgi:hypothetical protein
MQLKRLFCPLLILGGIFLAAGLRGAEIGIEFTGYVRDEKGLALALRNPASGYSKWVAVGQEFEAYAVLRLDEKTDILTVKKGGAEFQLPLIRSKVKQADAEPTPEIKKQVLNNLRQLAAAADQFYLENGVSRASYDDLVGMTKYVKRVNPVDGEDYRGIQFEQGKVIQTRTSQGYVISYRP